MSRERRRRIAWQKWGPGYILITPAIILLVAMMAYPVIQTIVFSFSSVQLPALKTVFVGSDNFVALFKDPETGPVILRTLVWTVGVVACRIVLGFLAALVFNAKVRGTVWMRVLVILPWAIPSVVGANLWNWLLQTDVGVVNETLRSWGLGALALNWLGDPHLALGAVMLAFSWSGFPFVMLLLLAGLQGIPEEQLEAGRVDGGNWWQLFRFITLPSLRGVLAVAILLETIQAINAFDTLVIMTDGGPANATQIWGLQIYTLGFTDFNLGGASALSSLLLVSTFALIAIYGASIKVNQSRKKGRQ